MMRCLKADSHRYRLTKSSNCFERCRIFQSDLYILYINPRIKSIFFRAFLKNLVQKLSFLFAHFQQGLLMTCLVLTIIPFHSAARNQKWSTDHPQSFYGTAGNCCVPELISVQLLYFRDKCNIITYVYKDY